jgi:hypothetical protein
MEGREGILKAARSILRISIADMMALHIRTQGAKSIARPKRLFQSLPMKAMALMATIPFGSGAVSIPHQSGPGGGYPILESPAPAVDGITIVYARQPNGRYEATNVLFQGQTYSMAGFHEVACQWVQTREGTLMAAPDRYAYFAPARELWGVILRDNGYIALDPSTLPSEITPEILGIRLNDAHMIARIHVCIGDRQEPGDALPVFQQVELTLDPHPTPQSIWSSFVDYQRERAILAQPPACLIPDFLKWLQHLTAESGFERWVFRPGMLFGDRMEWWGDGNRRRTEHEGLDFVEGLSSGAGIRNIPEGTPVRAIADGEIAAFLDDFLGKTVVVRHSSIVDRNGDIFHTLYSHIKPATGQVGPVATGGLLGHVGKSTAAGAPAHLHLSGAWIPQSILPNQIGMNHIDPTFVPVVLINFNELLTAPPEARPFRK